MENIKLELIKHIAGSIDCGEICYYNSKTGEIITIPSIYDDVDDEEFKECFKDDLKKIAQQKKDFIKIEPLESFESFKIMENFVHEVDDNQLKTTLSETLQRRKPFSNFKYLINNTEYRESWFQFKQNEIEEIVRKILKVNEKH